MGADGLWVRTAHTALSGGLTLGLFLHRTGEAEPSQRPAGNGGRGVAGSAVLHHGLPGPGAAGWHRGVRAALGARKALRGGRRDALVE